MLPFVSFCAIPTPALVASLQLIRLWLPDDALWWPLGFTLEAGPQNTAQPYNFERYYKPTVKSPARTTCRCLMPGGWNTGAIL
jgi:hypothetical protein